jgi:hypothetical protein
MKNGGIKMITETEAVKDFIDNVKLAPILTLSILKDMGIVTQEEYSEIIIRTEVRAKC